MQAEPSREPGDPARWLAEHGDALYRYALSQLGDRAAAEDLVQETLLAALKGRASFGGESSVRTWLVGILRRKVVDEFRRRGRVALEPTPEGTGDDPYFTKAGKWKHAPRQMAEDPARHALDREFWEIFERCREHLPPPLAEAFLLRELESLDMAEICNILDITATNLSVRLHRARLALRQCLEKHWNSTRD